MTAYFENLTIAMYVFFYIFNTHVKFRINWILFTIQSINLFFIHNLRSQKYEIETFE